MCTLSLLGEQISSTIEWYNNISNFRRRSLVLMTYYGVVLLLSGYQADEQHILKQYRAIIDL